MKVEINSKETALVVVDMQKDLVKGARKELVQMVEEDNVIENTYRVVKAARKAGLPIYHVKTVHRKDGADSVSSVTDLSLKAPLGQKMPLMLVEGTPGSEIIEELTPEQGDYIITKRRGNAFYNTDLELLLRSKGVKTVILVGVVTNACIDATLKGARERDFNVIIPIDTTATMNREIQDFYTKNVFPKAAITMNTDETIEALGKA